MNSFFVVVDGPYYLTTGKGDPPRTNRKDKARRFSSEAAAQRAIEQAKLTHPSKEREYKVLPVQKPQVPEPAP
jgi:hypothetical protein